MKTLWLLMAEHGSAAIPLADICERYFHLSAKEANHRARRQTLPVPAFRASASQKSPWLVHAEDLAGLLDKQRKRALSDHRAVNF